MQTTKQALGEALKQLLEQKTLNKITVSDLTDLCGVNRQTFYYHFRDIYDLLEWLYKEDLTKSVMPEYYDAHKWQIPYLALYRNLKKNRVLVINVYHSAQKELIERYVHQEAFRLLKEALDDWEADLGISAGEDNKRFIAAFYQAALVDMIFDWIDRGMREEPEEIVRKTALLLEGTFEDALRKMQDH